MPGPAGRCFNSGGAVFVMWITTVLNVALGVLLVGALCGALMYVWDRYRQELVREEGVPVLARIVEAEDRYWQPWTPPSAISLRFMGLEMHRADLPPNSPLFQEMRLPANGRVIYTFDPDVPDLRQFLTDVAERMRKLDREPPTTPAEEEVARRMRVKLPCPWQRLLPVEFTGGRKVYEVAVKLDKTLLPGGEPVDEFVYCLAMADGSKTQALMIRPPAAKSLPAPDGGPSGRLGGL